jgi:hypothetical protein
MIPLGDYLQVYWSQGLNFSFALKIVVFIQFSNFVFIFVLVRVVSGLI